MALCRKTRVKSFAVFGGVEQDEQIQTLIKGVDILIATPGRMFDLISQKAIDIRQVKILILDEADQMLAKGFFDDIQCIKRLLKQRHQTLFFSATINKNIKKLRIPSYNVCYTKLLRFDAYLCMRTSRSPWLSAG